MPTWSHWRMRELLAALVIACCGSAGAADAPRVVEAWRTYTKADGLPSDKIFAVLAGHDGVWAGTTGGLARLHDDKWRVFGPEDGLAHRVVLSLAQSEETGDLWIGTMGGLSRYSAGRIDSFDQMNSGLANDVVYGVAVQGDQVWAATAAGLSRFDTRTAAWTIFNETNTPMHERWCYNITTGAAGKVYVAVWGGGVLEYDIARDAWRDYRDPDKEMEIDLFRDDGLVHDVVGAVSYGDGLLWASTYFGMSRYDGRRWRGYMAHDSGLPSNFVNSVFADGKAVWVSTDHGLGYLDGDTWVVYRRVGTGGEVSVSKGGEAPERRATSTGIAHDFVLAVDVVDDTVWVATGRGLSRSVP